MNKKIFLFFFQLILCFSLIAQNTKERKADRMVSLYQYADAAKLYKEVVDKEGARHIMSKLAFCYQKLNDYQQANYWYDKAFEYEIKTQSELTNYIDVLKSNKRFERAKQVIKQYRAMLPTADDKLKAIDEMTALYRLDSQYTVKPTSINSELAEFGTMFYQKGLLYAAEKKLTPDDDVFKWNNNSYLDIYYVEKRDVPTELTAPSQIKGAVNTMFHESNPTISEDNNTMYFTRNFYNNGKKSYAKDNTLMLEILEAERVGDKWKVKRPFPYNNKNYSTGHPFYHEREGKLYFVSDMPGGYGGTDLYVCEKTGDTWGQPKNLGPVVNSDKNEFFPFVGADSVLYFSSSGHIGLGGLDVFKSIQDKGGNWTKPQNLGIGMNSDKDDFALILDRDKRTGYLSSNRDGGKGGDDIYYFESLAPKPIVMDTVLTLTKVKKDTKPKSTFIDYAVKVEDEETGVPLRGVMVTLQDDVDRSTQSNMSDEDGRAYFRIDPTHTFTVKINKDGYLNTAKNSFKGDDPKAGNLSMYKKELNRALVIKHIYYPFDKTIITPEAAERLDILVNIMKENPDIEVELSSHTDSRASNAYNQKLSEGRAQSAVEYIIGKGIRKSRIVARGYGESKLINKCKDGVECNEWEHAQNRRTEFKVIGLNGGTVSSSK